MPERWRYLTAAETEAAKHIFADGLDYGKIKIYAGIPYLPPIRTAIAPNGNIYFPRRHCPPDFILAGSTYTMWLIHELTHVWQHQQGFRPWLGGLCLSCTGAYFRRRAYVYPPPEHITDFSRLNMEQQADLIAHYYAARYLPLNAHTPQLPRLQTALAEFLSNPKQKKLLPRYAFA
ncbi:type IV secretion protein Rhs [Neisseria animalis]|uniref:Type IV secretion protein Rhs n=1 Tax=Neisseria animalis TaxID=492 RepID=A0A5P3MNN3_NEIAN|nr:type IV secretion protein Rhs [Neisseria animalis]QEY23146.1 type IV secretion protein Rhs [Neisseria animalis]ROW32476.1 type IV secretion protein Rhs [Neisseria animalis]VEE08237.1 Uncharacterised protein [Neisseria animalis]